MEKKKVLTKILVEISRVILGVTFTFSGFVKSVDPLGTAYKIEDYLIAFGFDSLLFLALPISIALCVTEFSVGVFMLFGIYRKWNSRALFLIMLFMTPLTLYLAIKNPVSDCGCFGDALVITNWQTFYKNLVLLGASIITLIYCERIRNVFTGKFYWMVGLFTISFVTLFSLYNYLVEPVFDFRPYKIGADLSKLVKVEEGKGDVYENIFIYEKDGVKKEFAEDNYPWDDTTWTFVDRISKLVKEGEKPAIKDFEITKLYLSSDKKSIEDEENITSEVLEDEEYVFLMIAHSLLDMNDAHLSRFEDVNNYAKDNHYKFYCLTSSTKDDIIKWEAENSINFEFCLTDERTLKTIMRSNPGLMLLKKGVIINKWPDRQVPAEESLTKPLEQLAFTQKIDAEKEDKQNLTIIVVLFITPLLVIKGFDVLFFRKKPEEQNK